MRIGILTNTYTPNLNGVSRAVANLEQSLRQKGIEVFIATPEVPGAIYEKNVLPIKSKPSPSQMSPDLYVPLFYINEVTKFFRENQVDLIHTHDTMVGGAEGVVIAMNLGLPCVHTFHTFTESYKYFELPGYKKFIRRHLKMVCQNYDHVTAPSIKVYKYLAGIGFSTPVSQILNVPNVADLNKLPPNTDLLKKLDIKKQLSDSDDFVFVTFCRLAKEKSIDVGIKILAPLIKKYPNIKYLICGDGPEKESLLNLARELGVQNKIIFSGGYIYNDLNGIGSCSDIFLFTSTTENLPTNLLEAMSLGLPVLAIDDESVDYLLKPQINGFKAALKDMTRYAEKMYLDKDMTKKMSVEAAKTSLELQEKDIAGDYVDLYERTIKFYSENPRSPTLVEKQMNGVYKIIEKSLGKILR